MKTKTINLYSFRELSEDAKQKAIENLWDINVDHKWWICTYEDAETIGLKITGFDLDRNKHATGELTTSANEVAQNIFNNHGKDCDTFKTAQSFMEEWQPLFNEYMDDQSPSYESRENEDQLTYLEDEFCKSLLEDYSSMLQKECDHLTSDEAIIETIEINEYYFTEDGKLA